MDLLRPVLGQKFAGIRVVPIVTKITLLFSVFLLASNFASNYINLVLNEGERIALANQIIVKDLAEAYGFASNQFEIFQFNANLEDAVSAMSDSARKSLRGERSAAFGLKPDGSFLFWASKAEAPPAFTDREALGKLADGGMEDGKITFRLADREFFGFYKYSDKWGAWLIRAEDREEFEESSRAIFVRVALIILGLTMVCLIVGAFLVSRILRFVGRLTRSIMLMQQDQRLELVDLRGAPNDEVTYLGASFNSLASTIDNLISIFKRFVTQDIAQRAYKEREIRLEGQTKHLAILFSDIKGFTFMTETLGNDIIDVLNLHYQRAIAEIHIHHGIVGSIIGDALLAVYGTMDSATNMSLEALRSAYRIQEVAAELRKEMGKKREELILRRGSLTDAEERVYRAILVEVGVGLDGGEVFYGNIGSYDRMTNTVIGDNVNSASRLEGLTRVYRVPVICSESIKADVEAAGPSEFRFVELDLVQVKGKTEGKRIFWPVRQDLVDDKLAAEFGRFEQGLSAYYAGDWAAAAEAWKAVGLPLVEVFRNRIAGGTPPSDWNGIWAMTTK